MTMPWKVRTANMLDTLEAGDLITSEIEVDDSQAVVTKITKTGTAKPDVPPPAPTPPGAKYLMPGDEVPNQVFVDEAGRERDFNTIRASRPIAITFIYTKCPIPTFCPAMDRQFAEAQALIKERGLTGKAALLSVSFDPKNDTPAVLKAHAQQLKSDPRVWNFVTGEREAIDRFATNMLVTLVRGQAANPEEIGHTLRTTVVGRDGRNRQELLWSRLDSHGSRHRTGTPALTLTPAERRLVARLRTPLAVQRYLNALPYNTEPPPVVRRCAAFAASSLIERRTASRRRCLRQRCSNSTGIRHSSSASNRSTSSTT
jgi:protein SCO1/2